MKETLPIMRREECAKAAQELPISHISEQELKWRRWKASELRREGWTKLPCGHWGAPSWWIRILREQTPNLRLFLGQLKTINPAEFEEARIRRSIADGRRNAEFRAFLSDCRHKPMTKEAAEEIAAKHQRVLSYFVAPNRSDESLCLYRSNLFVSAGAFKWFARLVRAHMQRFDKSVIRKAARQRSRDIFERYEIQDEYERLKVEAMEGMRLYRNQLRKTGNIDRSLRQTKNAISRLGRSLSRKSYWSAFAQYAKSCPTGKRLAPAHISAMLIAYRHGKPHYVSLLLSGKL
jgi:hypothetical protein